MGRLVAFDESGNTGSDLLNPDQPTFVLASCDFTLEETDSLLEAVRNDSTNEVKFTKLKKSSAGRLAILKFLADGKISSSRVKVFGFHKRFMVVTKIVDILVETIAYRTGFDLYKDGANIALSNLHYCCMPVFCGTNCFDQLLCVFVEMIRRRDTDSISAFYNVVEDAKLVCADGKYKSLFIPIEESKFIIDDILDANDANALDPATSAFFSLTSAWGEQYGNSFKVLHDASKPIARDQEVLEKMMDVRGPYNKVGYDRRGFEFPLRSDRIEFGDSVTDSRIQVADMISGSWNHWARGVALRKFQDDFWHQLEQSGIAKLALGVVWPSTGVTPEEVGADGGGGCNPVDEMLRALRNRRLES